MRRSRTADEQHDFPTVKLSLKVSLSLLLYAAIGDLFCPFTSEEVFLGSELTIVNIVDF